MLFQDKEDYRETLSLIMFSCLDLHTHSDRSETSAKVHSNSAKLMSLSFQEITMFQAHVFQEKSVLVSDN